MRSRSDAGQFSMAALMVALALVAVLTAAGVGVFLLGDNGPGSSGVSGSGSEAGLADDISAKSTLSQAQTAAATAAAAGGYGSLSAATLSASQQGLQFTSGPSTSTSMVSIASTGSGAAGATGGSPFGASNSLGSSFGSSSSTGSPGAGGANPLGGAGSPGGESGGSATMAVYSPSNTCWYLWLGTGGPLYGAQTDQQQCQAPPLPSAPTPGPVSSSAIGWSASGYPAP